ncbi:MAG: hypothetical protein WD269_00555 [Acidimicrobiia bacterium]
MLVATLGMLLLARAIAPSVVDIPAISTVDSLLINTSAPEQSQITTTTTLVPTPMITDSDTRWLSGEMQEFVSETRDSGRVFGPSQVFDEPSCIKTAYAREHPGLDDGLFTVGAVRLFRQDRTSQEFDIHLPGNEYAPTEWATSLVAEFSGPDWATFDDLLEHVVRLSAVSAWVEPIRRPTHCLIVEIIDVSESFGVGADP